MLINLLPPEQLDKIRSIKLSHRAVGLVLIAVFLNAAVLGYLFLLYLNLDGEFSYVQGKSLSEDVEERVKDLADFEDKVKKTYSFIERAKKINKEEETQFLWSYVLRELSDFSVEGIRFEKFKVADDDFSQITLTGTANSRDEVLNLEKKLRDSKYYKEIVSPISNLISKDNVSFEFTLKLKDE